VKLIVLLVSNTIWKISRIDESME